MGYYEMIKEAILALKDRTGSSSMAIKKVRHQSSYSSSCALGKPLFWPDPASSPRPAPPNQQFIESAHPEIKFAQHSLRAALCTATHTRARARTTQSCSWEVAL